MKTQTSTITKQAKCVGIGFIRAYRQKTRIKLYDVTFRCQCCGHTGWDGTKHIKALKKLLGKGYEVEWRGRHGFVMPSVFVYEV